MKRLTIGNRMVVGIACFAAAACVTLWVASTSTAQVPDDGVVEIDTYSPTAGPSPMAMRFTGTCLWTDGIPAETARVYVFRVVSGSEEPYGQMTSFPVSSDGSFTGWLVVPSGFPAGAYRASLSCSLGDVVHPSSDEVDIAIEPGPGLDVTVSPPTGPPGTTVSVSGTCGLGATGVVATFASSLGGPALPVVTAEVDGAGFELELAAPEVGPATVGVACVGAGGEVLGSGGAVIEVTATPPTTVPVTTTSTVPGDGGDDDSDGGGPVTPKFTG